MHLLAEPHFLPAPFQECPLCPPPPIHTHTPYNTHPQPPCFCPPPLPLQRRYLDAVPAIVPLLDREQRATQQRVEGVRRDLASLGADQLKVMDSRGAHSAEG